MRRWHTMVLVVFLAANARLTAKTYDPILYGAKPDG